MIDIFYTMMDKNDLLMFDCQYMKDKSNNTLVKFFARMDENLVNTKNIHGLANALTILELPFSIGEFGIQSQKDIFAGALIFEYFFTIHKKTKKTINDLTMYFLP